MKLLQAMYTLQSLQEVSFIIGVATAKDTHAHCCASQVCSVHEWKLGGHVSSFIQGLHGSDACVATLGSGFR